MMRIIKFLIVVLLIIFGILFARNNIFKFCVQQGLYYHTGLWLEAEHLAINFTTVEARGVKIFNPRGFSGTLMLSVPELWARYDISALLHKKIKISEGRLYVNELLFVTDPAGRNNFMAVNKIRAERSPLPEDLSKVHFWSFYIELLHLRVGKVIYRDRSSGQEPQISEFNINMERDFQAVSEIRPLMKDIFIKALPKNVVNSVFDPKARMLRKAVNETVSTAGHLTGGAVKTSTNILKKIVDEFTSIVTSPFEKQE